MIDIDVTDYRRLAFKHINALPRDKKEGLEEGDLLNAAYTGIWLASKAFNKDRDGTEFTTFCYWYIQRELTNLKFRQTTLKGKTINVKRDTDYLYDDLVTFSDQEGEEGDIGELEALAIPSFFEEDTFVQEFLDDIPLEGDKKDFFYDLYHNDSITAVKNYMDKNGCSRQAAYLIKKKTLNIVQDYYARLNR